MPLLMDSSDASDINRALGLPRREHLVFDASSLQKQAHLPSEFLWPKDDLVHHLDELDEPLIDLSGFLRGDDQATARAVEQIRTACSKHGFFQVTNHGVDVNLVRPAYDATFSIFNLPLSRKLSAFRKPGTVPGYSGAHTDRFSSKLPWKETFSFEYSGDGDDDTGEVVPYFKSALGEEFARAGLVFQKYCQAMKTLALKIFDLLAISLGVERSHYRRLFQDGDSIMRCNYYPPCNDSSSTLGTGPHSDPNVLTILHQDQVGGLQVLVGNKWLAVRPRQDCLVVNIGDTFMASTNGLYKSCLHRAVVNRTRERRSLVFFVCPRGDKVVKPPQELVAREGRRKYPDFTWSDLLEFTQKHYRADSATLQSFVPWLLERNHASP